MSYSQFVVNKKEATGIVFKKSSLPKVKPRVIDDEGVIVEPIIVRRVKNKDAYFQNKTSKLQCGPALDYDGRNQLQLLQKERVKAAAEARVKAAEKARRAAESRVVARAKAVRDAEERASKPAIGEKRISKPNPLYGDSIMSFARTKEGSLTEKPATHATVSN